MRAWLTQLHFVRPDWLWLLLVVPLLGAFALRRRPAQAALRRLVDADLLPFLLQGRARNRWLPVALLVAGGLVAILALAGPSWSRIAEPLYADRAVQVVALSLSQRMLAQDVAPSRLDRARYKVRDLFGANRDGLNGLVAYAGDAFVVAPLTSDAHSLDELLAALAPDTMPVDGDDLVAAIQRGATLIRHAKSGGGSLVVITDRGSPEAQQAARQVLDEGVHVSVLGIGTPEGGPVPLADGGFLRDGQGNIELARRDDDSLAALAAAGGGRYVPMRTDHGDIQLLHGELRGGRGPTATGQQGERWQDQGPWLLLLLLPIVAMTFRRGWLLLLPLLLLPLVPGRAEATTWSDLWRRPDQQAAQALRQGHAKQAEQLARDPALRGAAAYRAGDYRTAIQALAPLPGAQAQYNLGNALAKAGRYQEAIDAYGRALAQDPTNADAKANRKAVKDWLRQQQKSKGDAQDKQHSGQGQRPPSDKQDQAGGKQQGQDKPRDGQGKASGDKGHAEGDGQNSSQDRQPGKPGQSGAARPMTAQEQAEQQARAAKAQQALRQQMDRALGSGKRPSDAPHQLGTLDKNDPQSRLPAELRQALQRVPDDPGALLRRKFELEYRQRHGMDLPSDAQP